MSQERLAEALGVHPQQIEKYEKGLNRVGAGRLLHIGKALGVPVSSFYEGLPGTGERSDGLDKRVRAVLMTPEGVRLAHAFAATRNDMLRRKIVDMVEAFVQASKESWPLEKGG